MSDKEKKRYGVSVDPGMFSRAEILQEAMLKKHPYLPIDARSVLKTAVGRGLDALEAEFSKPNVRTLGAGTCDERK